MGEYSQNPTYPDGDAYDPSYGPKTMTWRFMLVLETEAETEEEAVANIQQELNRCSNYHPADIGEWERVENEKE